MNVVYGLNRRAWDERVRRGDSYIDTATDSDFNRPLAVADPNGWFGNDVSGKRILCLAAGGGRHSVLFAAAGAVVTVVDISPEMLALDRKRASERSLQIRTIDASMDKLPMLQSGEFELVMHPVSTCYVPDITAVYREVARVLRPGGIYVSVHKQPPSLQANHGHAARAQGYRITEPYYRNDPLPPANEDCLHRESGTVEFLHRWESLIGGLCRTGFVIEDLIEPRHHDAKAEPGSFRHRSYYLPPFVSIKARREVKTIQQSPPRLWVPG